MTQPLRTAAEMHELVVGTDTSTAELWEALTTLPLGTLLGQYFDDDLVRGIAATDGLIGTFADLDDPGLRQNVCFLYHVIGGGSGDWDVPVGGMGAVSGRSTRRRRRPAPRSGPASPSPASIRSTGPSRPNPEPSAGR